MSTAKVEPQKPALDQATLEAIKTLVTELRAPSEDDKKKLAAQQQERKDQGLIEATRQANEKANQSACPHRQDRGKSNLTALVLVKGNIGLQDSFILCQQCRKITFFGEPDWNNYARLCAD